MERRVDSESDRDLLVGQIELLDEVVEDLHEEGFFWNERRLKERLGRSYHQPPVAKNECWQLLIQRALKDRGDVDEYGSVMCMLGKLEEVSMKGLYLLSEDRQSEEMDFSTLSTRVLQVAASAASFLLWNRYELNDGAEEAASFGLSDPPVISERNRCFLAEWTPSLLALLDSDPRKFFEVVLVAVVEESLPEEYFSDSAKNEAGFTTQTDLLPLCDGKRLRINADEGVKDDAYFHLFAYGVPVYQSSECLQAGIDEFWDDEETVLRRKNRFRNQLDDFARLYKRRLLEHLENESLFFMNLGQRLEGLSGLCDRARSELGCVAFGTPEDRGVRTSGNLVLQSTPTGNVSLDRNILKREGFPFFVMRYQGGYVIGSTNVSGTRLYSEPVGYRREDFLILTPAQLQTLSEGVVLEEEIMTRLFFLRLLIERFEQSESASEG